MYLFFFSRYFCYFLTCEPNVLRLPIQLLQIGPVIVQLFRRWFLCKTPRDYAEILAPTMYNYGWGYPMPVFIFIIVLIYSTMSPLILVFGTIYFGLAYLVLKYQLLYGLYYQPFFFNLIGYMVFNALSASLLTKGIL
jgi:calcium permeable stress-gated cation channel